MPELYLRLSCGTRVPAKLCLSCDEIVAAYQWQHATGVCTDCSVRCAECDCWFARDQCGELGGVWLCRECGELEDAAASVRYREDDCCGGVCRRCVEGL